LLAPARIGLMTLLREMGNLAPFSDAMSAWIRPLT
jgi:hypothetical protein